MCKAKVFFLLANEDFFGVGKKNFWQLVRKTVLRPQLCGDVRCLFIASNFLGSDESVFSESGLEEVHSLREKAVREDIARRLGNVCSNFSRDEFDELVAVMAARQLKCERRLLW
jgi:hypothetical protein